MRIPSVKNLQYYAKGKRGLVYIGLYKGKKVAIKVKNPESKAVQRIPNEAKFLKILNNHHIGPKLLKHSEGYLIMEFINGLRFLDATLSPVQFKKVLQQVLRQCYTMDKLGIAKEEMHHPFKHIIIAKGNKPVMIDFERCHHTEKPHNVTQFLQCIRNMDALKKKGIYIKKRNILKASQLYKHDITNKSFITIIDLLR